MITKIVIALALSLVTAMTARLGWVEWRYSSTKTELTRVSDLLAQSEKTVEQERTARVAAEDAAAAAEQRRNATFEAERAIRDEPVTYQCSTSPSVQRALDILRDRQRTRSSATTDPG